jgi:hypothetical protein
MNTRLVLMNAKVYSEMKPQPTLWTARDPGSSAASPVVRYFNASSPAVGGRCGCTAGLLPPRSEMSGTALSPKAVWIRRLAKAQTRATSGCK